MRLQAMANHGILPNSGRHITPQQLVAALGRTYCMSFSIANQLLAPMYPIWEGRGWFDLSDLDLHGAIEHDASLTVSPPWVPSFARKLCAVRAADPCRVVSPQREDLNSPYPESKRRLGQSIPSQRKLDLYFPRDAPPYTADNFSRALAHVRKASRDLNGQYNMSLMQHLFGSGNTALILAIVGGEMADVRHWLGAEGGYEKFREGWTPKTRSFTGIVSYLARSTDPSAWTHADRVLRPHAEHRGRAKVHAADRVGCALGPRASDGQLQDERGWLARDQAQPREEAQDELSQLVECEMRLGELVSCVVVASLCELASRLCGRTLRGEFATSTQGATRESTSRPDPVASRGDCRQPRPR